MTAKYDDEFYLGQADASTQSARRVLPILLTLMPELKSAIDIGCGVGTWLSICLENGFDEVVGIDGDYVNKSLLRIPEDSFIASDLSNDFVSLVNKKFDLAINLEVAEHLEEKRADSFVTSLTALSDVILFSGAVPFQGGVSHVNEQWPDYWVKKFRAQGYYPLDIIRPLVWEDKKIVDHYRQNIIVFSTKEIIGNIFPDYDFDTIPELAAMHPELALTLHKRAKTLSPFAKVAKSAVHMLSCFVPAKEK